MVEVLPSRQISSSWQSSPAPAITRPSASAAATPEEAYTSASSPLSCPSSREAMDPEPMPTVKPAAWMIAMRENTTPTAPEALVFSWETK